MTMDTSNFYLVTLIEGPKYVHIKLINIRQEIINEYNLKDKATPDEYFYIMATKSMYELPQSGLLANELFEKRLNKHGYHQSKLVPRL